MADEARQHHYVPQAYLRGFGFKRTKHWMVVAHDVKRKQTFETNTRNVCGERDFMRYEMEGQPPTRLEHELGGFEGKACEAIRRVVESGTFEGEDKIQVLNLMALLGVRSPERRERLSDFIGRTTKAMLDLALSDKRQWERDMERIARRKGKAYEKSYEEVKAFHDSGKYTINVPRERLIGMELGVFETVLTELFKRKWTLYLTTEKRGHFVTTDTPVVVAFNEPEKYPAWVGPGYALEGTQVYFPLTKKGFLIGRWERGDCTEEAGQPFVAAVNTHMAQYSQGQVFSDARSILHHDWVLNLHWDTKFIERWSTPPTKEEIAEMKDRFGQTENT